MRILPFFLLALVACDDVETPDDGNEQEFITTIELTIDGTVYTWTDPENDGDPIIDPITLPADSTLPVSVTFTNDLEDPPEDITAEVEAESDEHQVFIGADGAFTFMYGDTDANGLPVGLEGTLETGPAASGELQLMLRHLPAQDGTPVKVAGLEDDFASGGTLPGEADVDVLFPLTIQ